MRYDQIDTLISRRRLSSFQCVLATDDLKPAKLAAIEKGLGTALRGLKRNEQATGIPGMAQCQGPRQQLNWAPPAAVYVVNLYGPAEKSAEQAVSLLRERARSLASAFRSAAPVRILGLVLVSEFSDKDLKAVQPFIASFVRAPQLDPIVEGEWRVCRKVDDRYFLNWTVNSYETRELTAIVTQTPSSGPTFTTQLSEPLDKGLRLILDANTKPAPTSGSDEDIDRLAHLVADGIESGTKMLQEAGYEP